jgi:TrpR-related protein YerC/YecD
MESIIKIHKDRPSKADGVSEQKLFEAIALLQNADEAQRFFEDLCTPAELQAMADRWEIIPLLTKEVPYQQIYEQTGVSVTTVGRVARTLRFGKGGYDMIYTRIGAKE